MIAPPMIKRPYFCKKRSGFSRLVFIASSLLIRIRFWDPEPYRKYQNESMYIPLISKKIADIKGIDEELVMNTTTDSACRIFDF